MKLNKTFCFFALMMIMIANLVSSKELANLISQRLNRFQVRINKHTIKKSLKEDEEGEKIPQILKTKVIIGFEILDFTTGIDMERKTSYLPPSTDYIYSAKGKKIYDLNKGGGGRYLYLLQKHKPMYEMTTTDKIVNTIRVQVGNSECGDLTLLPTDLNKGAGGKFIYLCYGHVVSEMKPLLPFSQVYLIQESGFKATETDTVEIDGVSHASECDLTNINLDTGGLNTFICWIRTSTLPKKMLQSNMLYKYSEKVKSKGTSEEVKSDYFNLANGNASNKIEISISRASSVEKTELGTHAVESELVWNWGKANGDVTISSSEATKLTHTMDMSCEADPGKYSKCTRLSRTAFYDIPYSYDKVFRSYDGVESIYHYNGNFTNFQSTSTTVEKCCYSFCKKGDKLCKDVQIEKVSACPFSVPTKQNVEVTPLEVKLPDGANVPVLVDIGWVKGEGASCPYGYSRLKNKDVNDDVMKGQNSYLYIYLCVRMKKLGDIQPEEKIVNYVKVVWANSCGGYSKANNLNADLSDYSDGSFTIPRIICFGYNNEIETGPITDIALSGRELSDGYTEPTESLTVGDKSSSLHLVFKRNKDLPSKIEFKNWSYSDFQALDVAMPTTLDEIVADGVKVVKSFKYVESKSTSFSFNVNVGASISVENKVGDAESKKAFKVSYNYTNQKTDKTSVTRKTSVSCEAPAGKTIKCIVSQSTQDYISNYTVDQIYKRADDTEIISLRSQIDGKLYSRGSSSISVSVCCESGCCTGSSNDPKYCFVTGSTTSKADVTCADMKKCFDDMQKKSDAITAIPKVEITSKLTTKSR